MAVLADYAKIAADRATASPDKPDVLEIIKHLERAAFQFAHVVDENSALCVGAVALADFDEMLVIKAQEHIESAIQTSLKIVGNGAAGMVATERAVERGRLLELEKKSEGGGN